AINIVGSVWLLFATRKVKITGEQAKAVAAGETPTTGHVYDGIEEYDNPLPGWWFKMFLLTVAFSVVYLILYPGLGNFKGVLGWTSAGQWQEQVQEAEEKYGPIYARF